jgi:hypothetical protein
MRGVLAAAVLMSACGVPVVGFPLADGGGPDAGCTAAQLMSDGANCGACGHSCLGGACAQGHCQPVTLASGLTNPVSVALDPAQVYFVESTATGTVRSCPKTGCDGGVAPTLADTQPFPSGISCLGATLAWANNGQGAGHSDGALWSCGLPNCFPQAQAPMQPATAAVVLDADGVYFVQLLNPGMVSVCHAVNCLNPKRLLTDLLYPSALALDNGAVYVAAYGTGAADGAVYSCVRTGCGDAGFPIALGERTVSGIAVDGDYVYWTSQGTATAAADGEVRRCLKTGCPDAGAEILASGRLSPYSIAVDNGRVYWTERGTRPDLRDGVIASCPVAGCSSGPDVLATGQVDPHGLALDGTALYWGSNGPAAAVKKLAR